MSRLQAPNLERSRELFAFLNWTKKLASIVAVSTRTGGIAVFVVVHLLLIVGGAVQYRQIARNLAPDFPWKQP